MKKLLLVNFLILICYLLLSQTINVDEIKKGANTEIVFENYKGPYRYKESIFDIRAIGKILANKQNKNNEIFRYHMKYSVINAIDDTTIDKNNAAIFSIDKDAKVDHVNNIILIISSYLETKYGYKIQDSNILSKFIVYYNATFRGNFDYFNENYKPIVMGYITKENAGISTKYYDWPGNTKILIPITNDAKKGKLSSLDTTELTDKQVIDELRKKDDKGIPERKDMVAFKEKELKEKEKELLETNKQLEKEKENIEKDQQKLNEKKEKLEEKKEQISKKEEELNKEKEKLKNMPDGKEREKKELEIKKKEEELNKEKEKIAKEEEQIKKEQEKIDQRKEELAKKEEQKKGTEKEIAKKQEEIQKDKEEIKKDESQLKLEKKPEEVKKELEKKSEELTKKTEELTKKEEKLIEKEKELEKREQSLRDNETDRNIFAGKLYYLKIKEYMEGGHYNNEMYIINAITRQIETQSELKTICGHKYDVFKDGVVVIAHEGSHSQFHSLFLLDRLNLKVKYKGTDDIFWRSFVEIKDGFIYAIIKKGDNFYLGKFNDKLERIAISVELIDANTFISFFENSIYINGADKSILILKKEDLSLEYKIKP